MPAVRAVSALPGMLRCLADMAVKRKIVFLSNAANFYVICVNIS